MVFTCNGSPKGEVTLYQDDDDVDIFVRGVRIAWFCGETGALFLAQPTEPGCTTLENVGVTFTGSKPDRRIEVHGADGPLKG